MKGGRADKIEESVLDVNPGGAKDPQAVDEAYKKTTTGKHNQWLAN